MSLLRNFRNPWEVGGGEVVGSGVLRNKAIQGNVLENLTSFDTPKENVLYSRINDTGNLLIVILNYDQRKLMKEAISNDAIDMWDYLIVPSIRHASDELDKYPFYKDRNNVNNIALLLHGNTDQQNHNAKGLLTFPYYQRNKNDWATLTVPEIQETYPFERNIEDMANDTWRHIYRMTNSLFNILSSINENDGNLILLSCTIGAEKAFIPEFFKLGTMKNIYMTPDFLSLGRRTPLNDMPRKRYFFNLSLNNEKNYKEGFYKYVRSDINAGDYTETATNKTITLNSRGEPFNLTNITSFDKEEYLKRYKARIYRKGVPIHDILLKEIPTESFNNNGN